MRNITSHTPGTFSWAELATTDSAAAKEFYGKLFAWVPKDVPAGPDMIYTMLTIEDQDAAALYQMNDEQQQAGVPPHWNSYVTTDNVDETASQAKELGGTVIMEPFDVMEAGRMAVIQDPTGATFCVWQAKQNIGAHMLNEPGGVCWNELATSDTARAGEFYSTLFGWSQDTQDMGNMQYTMFMNAGNPAAGMIELDKNWGDVPPYWLIYFQVTDCAGILASAQDLGANVLVPQTDIPGMGSFGVVQDLTGAAFGVFEGSNPEK